MTGSMRPEWGDWLEGYLFDRRIVVVRGPLDDLTATRAATELMTLDATGDEAVTLQLDSPGGPLSAAFTLVDVVENLGVPVHVTCLGRVETTAVAVVAACSHRLALTHTQFKMGDPPVSIDQPASNLGRVVGAELDRLRRFHEVLARHCTTPLAQLAEWCREGRYLDPPAALAAGLIDEVARGRVPLRPVR